MYEFYITLPPRSLSDITLFCTTTTTNMSYLNCSALRRLLIIIICLSVRPSIHPFVQTTFFLSICHYIKLLLYLYIVVVFVVCRIVVVCWQLKNINYMIFHINHNENMMNLMQSKF